MDNHEQDNVARAQTEMASREPSLQTAGVQQARCVPCSSADAWWAVAAPPGLIVPAQQSTPCLKAVQLSARAPAFCGRQETPAINPLSAVSGLLVVLSALSWTSEIVWHGTGPWGHLQSPDGETPQKTGRHPFVRGFGGPTTAPAV